MTQNDIHKCIISYGLYPLTLVIKELEDSESYEKCAEIKNAVEEYKRKFDYLKTGELERWSIELEMEYFNELTRITKTDGSIVKSNMEWYVKDIKKRLKI